MTLRTSWLSLLLIMTAPHPARAQQDGAAAAAAAASDPAATPGSDPAAATPAGETAETRAAKAEERARIQELRAQEAEQERDAVKGGSLMSLGITVGDALAVQSPAWETSNVRQRTVKVVNLPYVQVMPFYWGKPQARREYCASAWSGGDEDSATNAALGIARKSAKQRVAAIKTALKAGMNMRHIHNEYLNQMSTVEAFLIISKVNAALRAPPSDAQAAMSEREAVEQLAQWEWNPTYRGSCLAMQFGFWVGLPAKYDASVEVRGARARREIEPAVAFGVAFSPHAYFSLLGGLTVASVEDTSSEGATLDRLFWAGTVGIGGNLDLVGALVR